jgi:uncharacterized membrane protein (UPF0182 family)
MKLKGNSLSGFCKLFLSSKLWHLINGQTMIKQNNQLLITKAQTSYQVLFGQVLFLKIHLINLQSFNLLTSFHGFSHKND